MILPWQIASAGNRLLALQGDDLLEVPIGSGRAHEGKYPKESTSCLIRGRQVLFLESMGIDERTLLEVATCIKRNITSYWDSIEWPTVMGVRRVSSVTAPE
jgi:hypothetical protein